MVLKREPLCRDCKGRGTTTIAKEVHHITPLRLGGRNTYENLEPLCKSCHSRRTMDERLGRG